VQRATVDADPDVQAALARIVTDDDDPHALHVIMPETRPLPLPLAFPGELGLFWGSVASDSADTSVEESRSFLTPVTPRGYASGGVRMQMRNLDTSALLTYNPLLLPKMIVQA